MPDIIIGFIPRLRLLHLFFLLPFAFRRLAVAVVAASVLLALAILRAATILHHRLVCAVLRFPMVFFDTTPVGRLLNRFSKDVDVLDNTLPFILRGWITTLLQVTLFEQSYFH